MTNRSSSSKRRVGIFGGTFDPVHEGHIANAEAAAKHLDLDLVLVIPAGDPYQKSGGRDITEGEARWKKVVAACRGRHKLRPSRVDLDRPGPTRTIDTVHDLMADPEFADADFFLIIGTDLDVDSWQEAEELSDLVTLAVVDRAGYPFRQPSSKWDVVRVPMEPIDISGTAIRGEEPHGPSPGQGLGDLSKGE